ncbi:hypothetical protein M8818_006855 [Zalaria obscura]|uniref:Uncharacterized protein n=1 Tax=Zalaria obscura TaxID=2024903 RepID=A0ACC3S525_9PEZI
MVHIALRSFQVCQTLTQPYGFSAGQCLRFSTTSKAALRIRHDRSGFAVSYGASLESNLHERTPRLIPGAPPSLLEAKWPIPFYYSNYPNLGGLQLKYPAGFTVRLREGLYALYLRPRHSPLALENEINVLLEFATAWASHTSLKPYVIEVM